MELHEIIVHVVAEATGSVEVLRTSHREGLRLSSRGALGEIDVLLPPRHRAARARLSRTVDGSFVASDLPSKDESEGVEIPAGLRFSPLPDAEFLFQAIDPSTPSEADVLCFTPERAFATSLTAAHVVDLPARFRGPSKPVAIPADVFRLIAAFDGLADVEVAFEESPADNSSDIRIFVKVESEHGALLGWFSSLSASPSLALDVTPATHQARFSADVLSTSSLPITAFALEKSAQLSLMSEPSPAGVCVSSAMLRRTLELLGAKTVLVGATAPRFPVVLRAASRAAVIAPLLLA